MTPVSAAARFITACPTHARILVAVSGGSDSLGLLIALVESVKILQRNDISLFAATIDHALRPESVAEAQLVANLCGTLNIPHQIATWSAEKPKTGIPAAARLARYHLLSAIAENISATCIVSGHTLNDQQETIAMRADRSTPDSIGLSGMADAMLFNRKIWVARPFLDVSRSEIRNYLLDRNIAWIDDPTNTNDAYERARVRKTLAGGPQSNTEDRTTPESRHQISHAIATFLFRHAEVLNQTITIVDRSACQGDLSGARALAILLAIMGGRSHVPGRDLIAKLTSTLHSDASMTLTLSRSVLTFRKDKIYITRELRDLQELTLDTGQTGIWDNRFFIQNRGPETLIVSAAVRRLNELPIELKQLPKSVVQRGLYARPCLGGQRTIHNYSEETQKPSGRSEITVEPYFPLFDLFLPIFDLPVANCVSAMFGRTEFPPFPVHYM